MSEDKLTEKDGVCDMYGHFCRQLRLLKNEMAGLEQKTVTREWVDDFVDDLATSEKPWDRAIERLKELDITVEIIEEKQGVEKDRKPATCQHCGGELVYAKGRGCFGCSKCKRLYWAGAEK